MLTRQELENLRDLRDLITDSITEVARLLESYNSHLFEIWKNSGKQVTDDLAGPNLSDIIDQLEDQVQEQDQHSPEEESEDDLLNRCTQR